MPPEGEPGLLERHAELRVPEVHRSRAAARVLRPGASVMTTSALLAAPSPVTTDGPELCHVVCCGEDVALCGEDVSEDPWCDPGHEATCPLCRLAVADGLPCPVTGCSRAVL